MDAIDVSCGHRVEKPVLFPKRERWLLTRDYLGQGDAKWFVVYPGTRVSLRPAIQHGARAASFLYVIDVAIPELGVLQLAGAYLLGRDGFVVTSDGHWLPEFSWWGMPAEAKPELLTFDFQIVRLRGTCLFLSSDWAYKNYAHFLNDAVARFHLFKRAGFSIGDIDYFFCGIPNSYCAGLLWRLGIPLDRCVVGRPDSAITADTILVPSLPGTQRIRPRWVVNFLQQSFLTQHRPPHRRLYIQRTGSRRIVNGANLAAMLAAKGFEICQPELDEDQRRTFSEAEIVIGAHGAALANLAFCQPRARVVELIPTDQPFAYRYYSLSSVADLTYAYLIGSSLVNRLQDSPLPSSYDFAVDESDFREALARTLDLGGSQS
jgi:hypothetical protein